MYTCYYYWLLAPLRESLVDSADRQSEFQIPMQWPGEVDCVLALYCDSNGLPEFFRVEIPGLTEERLPESYLPMLQATKEHMLTVLRAAYRADIILASVSSVHTYVRDGLPVTTSLAMELRGGIDFDAESIKNLYIHSFNMREVLRLFQDGNDARIPLQYRFLSFFKLLENHFSPNQRWNYAELEAMLQPHAAAFVQMGFRRTVRVTIFDLRDRCAHIRTGGLLGVTHLNHSAAVDVEKVLPYLRSISAEIVNLRANGTFVFDTAVVQGIQL